jgi:hypothetical protein
MNNGNLQYLGLNEDGNAARFRFEGDNEFTIDRAGLNDYLKKITLQDLRTETGIRNHHTMLNAADALGLDTGGKDEIGILAREHLKTNPFAQFFKTVLNEAFGTGHPGGEANQPRPQVASPTAP